MQTGQTGQQNGGGLQTGQTGQQKVEGCRLDRQDNRMGEGCRLDRQDNRRWRVADWTDRTTEGGGLQTGQTGQQKVEGCRLDRQDNRMGELLGRDLVLNEAIPGHIVC